MSLLDFFRRKRACRHKADTGFGTVPSDMAPGRDFTVVMNFPIGDHVGWDGRIYLMSRSLCHCNLCGEDWWAGVGYMPQSPVPKDETAVWTSISKSSPDEPGTARNSVKLSGGRS